MSITETNPPTPPGSSVVGDRVLDANGQWIEYSKATGKPVRFIQRPGKTND